MQVFYGTLPRTAPVAVHQPVDWGRHIMRLPTGPSGTPKPRHTRFPRMIRRLPSIRCLWPEFKPAKAPRVTKWDKGFPSQDSLFPTLNTLFPNPNNPVSPTLQLPPLPAPPPVPTPIPWDRIKEAKHVFRQHGPFPRPERSKIILQFLRSVGCSASSTPTQEEFWIAGALANVSKQTAYRVWRDRHKIRRPSSYKQTRDLDEILAAIDSAKNYIYASYFIFTSEELSQALIERARAGVRVLLYTDRCGIKADTLKALLFYDVDVRQRPSSSTMHEKMLIVDGVCVFLGSSNATLNGFGSIGHLASRNQEANVLVTDLLLVEKFEEKFKAEWSKAIPAKPTRSFARSS